MSDLDPKFKTEIEFPFAGLFDPADQLAQFVANLARAVNDLLLANRRLDLSLADDESNHQAIYDIKAVASHVWELIKFLKESRTPEIEDFIAGLPQEVKDERDQALTLFDAEPPPNEKSFKALLGSARDQASHYSELDHKLLIGAFTEFGKPHPDGRVSKGKLFIGERVKDFYAEFASALDYHLFFSTKDEDLEPIKRFITQLQEITGPLISFSRVAVQEYLHQHRDKLTITPV